MADAKDELDGALSEAGDLAWRDDGLARIVEMLSGLVGNPVYVVDSSFKAMAIVDDPDMEEMSVNWMHAARHGYLSYDVVANLIRSDELHEIESSRCATVVNSEFFYVPFINYNLRHAGKVQGHLFVVQMYREIRRGDLEAVDLIAPFALRAMLSDPDFQSRRGPLYEHFVIDWIEGGLRDPAYIRRQLEALSFNPDDYAAVAVIELASDSGFGRESLARLLEDRKGCRAVSCGGQVVALFQLKSPTEKEAVLRKIRDICRSQRCRAYAGDVQEDAMGVPRAYRQALETMRLCRALGVEESVVSYGDVAAYQPYLRFASAEELDSFVHPAVWSLVEYDREHAVQLLPTLSAFLKNDRDVQKTAESLFVHRNTLTYRMRRIQELCPVDLDDFATRNRLVSSILVVENREGIVTHLEKTGLRPNPPVG